MSTPPRLVELECPKCKSLSWRIDYDVRGSMLAGLPELGYSEREYACLKCNRKGTGWAVARGSPPAFLLQPHSMYPMQAAEFLEWQAVLEEHFPDHPRLRDVKWAGVGGAESAARAAARHEAWSRSDAGRRKYTCPCCGCIAFRDPPGSYEDCPTCRWTDDALALEYATTMTGGANALTLEESQRAYERTRPPRPGLLQRLLAFAQPERGPERDQQWRPIDAGKDRFRVWPGRDADLAPARDSRLYYWRGGPPFVRDLKADDRPGYFDNPSDDFAFGRLLHVMGEPKLGGAERAGDEFRFLMLRQWGRPVAVRIDRDSLYVKVLSGGPMGGGLIASDERPVSQKEFAGFWDRLRAADFWNAPLRTQDQGLDGSFWLLEGSGPTGHRVLIRWSPKRGASGGFRGACEYLLRLARLDGELD